MPRPIDEQVAQARERVVRVRRIVERNRKLLTDTRHRGGFVEDANLRLLEGSLIIVEDELIRLVEESIQDQKE